MQRDGFRDIDSTNDPRQFLARYTARKPDMLLLDLHMPGLDGFAVLEQLRGRIQEDDFVPILVLTADITPQARQSALAAGAKDFLTKPVDPTEVILRIKNLLQTRYYYRQLKRQNETLERKVSDRTRELEKAQIEILERLARAAEYRDDETGHHAQRVGHISALIARELEMTDSEVVLIRRAAPLHDVGKIGIPDGILLKPGKLTAEEFDEMKKHTSIGAGILQIVHAADVFDALTHERPYKRAWSVDEALQEIRDLNGRFFDPRVVDAVLSLHETGRLQVEGAPPPVADIFREDTGEELKDLAQRAAEAEARAQASAAEASAGS